MNFGIIGSGSIARIHAVAITSMNGGRLHSIYGRNEESSRKLAAAHNVPCFSDLDRFLADPELDIVTICTPSGAHLEPALAALSAGKHVVVEKPIEIRTARIDRMIDAAEQSGKVLASILNRRFTPAMNHMADAVRTGRFGTLTSASCYVKWFRDQAYYDSADWRGTTRLDGGGALMNQAIHAVDALLSLVGPVRFVQAHTACLAHDAIEVEDIAVALLQFESGALGVIEAATCCASNAGHPIRIQISGTGGSAFLADDSFEVWDFLQPKPADSSVITAGAQSTHPPAGANDPNLIQSTQHRMNLEHIVHCIHDGSEPITSARRARDAVALIEAIYQSADSGGERIPL